jgi:hypothetical protein
VAYTKPDRRFEMEWDETRAVFLENVNAFLASN